MKKTMAMTMALLMGTAVMVPTAQASWLSAFLLSGTDLRERVDYIKHYPERVKQNLRDKGNEIAENAFLALLSKIYGAPMHDTSMDFSEETLTPEQWQSLYVAAGGYDPIGFSGPLRIDTSGETTTPNAITNLEEMVPVSYEELNACRVSMGLEPLRLEPEWREIAQYKAQQMVDLLKYPEQVDVDAFKKQETDWAKEEETISVCMPFHSYVCQSLPQLVSGLVNSAEYQKAMANPAVKEVAIGIAKGSYQSMSMISITMVLIKPK